MAKFRPVFIIPMLAIAAAVVALAAWKNNYWLLACLPLVYFGRVCAAPNMNLADGCLPQVFLILSLLLGFIFGPIWVLPGASCWLTWAASSIWMGVAISGRMQRASFLNLKDQDLIDALTALIGLLGKSEDAMYSSRPVDEIKQTLGFEVTRIKMTGEYDRQEIALLNAPTGDIQEIAMVNGWHDDYLRLSLTIDEFTKECLSDPIVKRRRQGEP